MKVFTIKEISEYLNVSQQTIRQKIKQLQKNKLLFVSYDTDGRIRLDVEQVEILIATYYKSVYNVYCEMYGIQKGVQVIPTRKGTIQRLKRKGGKEVFYIRNLPLAYDQEGKEIIYKSPKFNTKEEAEKEQAYLLMKREKETQKLDSEKSRDESVYLTKMKQRYFKEYCLEWIENKEVRLSTKGNYLTIARLLFERIEDVRLGDLTAGTINRWFMSLERNIVETQILLMGFFKHLYKLDVISEVTFKKIEKVKVATPVMKPALTKEQVQAVFDAVKGNKQEMLVHLLFKTGLRLSEALALTKDDVIIHPNDLIEVKVNKTLSVNRINYEVVVEPPKTTSSNRSVFVSDSYLLGLLKKALNNTKNILFKGYSGSYLRSQTIWTLFHRLGIKLGVYLSPHIARHTYISLALANNVDLYALTAQVGHKNPTMILSVYGKLVLDRKTIFKDFNVLK